MGATGWHSGRITINREVTPKTVLCPDRRHPTGALILSLVPPVRESWYALGQMEVST